MSGNGFKASLPESVRNTFAVLRASAEAGRLAHGYVITCDNMEWGIELATLLLQWINCPEANRPCGHCRSCLHVASRSHPDVAWLEPESKSRVIVIEQIRDLNHIIHQKSYEGGWKAAVILYADRLNESAANSFLKTLEEPPEKCLLLLITDSPQKFLPTILSRCQRVQLGDSGKSGNASKIEQAMLEWLRRRHSEGTASGQSAWIAAILNEVRSNAEEEEKNAAVEGTSEDLIKARVQAQVVEARIDILRTLYRWERDLLVCSYMTDVNELHYPDEWTTLQQQSHGLSLAQHMSRLERVDMAVRLLEGNVPEGSVWEAVLQV